MDAGGPSMEVTDKLIINGSGSSKGGRFHTVEINGSGTVSGDVECASLLFNGSGKTDGHVKTQTLTISGSGKISGSAEAESIRINGTGVIKGDVKTERLNVAGFSSFGGGVKADDIFISGKAGLEGDCETETFRSEGKCKIGGLLNADEVSMKLAAGESRVKEIGCRHLKVMSRKSVLTRFKLMPAPVLTAELIEGDIIELADTNAKTVRGNHVRIGAGCTIGTVEYSGDFTCDPTALVNKVVKI
ncbi:hypothetical protein FH505_17360 [Bacillus velezensis]|nr:hypothetical protein [Bacillus velezensis]TNU62724.1 hypothetical protein FH505_17360 [Bacillus velezensis]